MIQDIIDLDEFRRNFLVYTLKILEILSEMKKTRILDIGCGTGVPTIELAKWSEGEVIGIDIDKQALARCNEKIRQEHLTSRVRTIHCSLMDMDFPDSYFDMIWAEGSVFVLGFKISLKDWRRYIIPGGYLVLHDAVGDLPEKLSVAKGLGYVCVEYILISGDEWWNRYFNPLQKKIDAIRDTCKGNAEAMTFLNARQKEIDDFNSDREANGSVYIVLQKSG